METKINDIKKDMLSIRIDDPYASLGVCMYLDAKGYEVCGLHVFGELNAISMLRRCHLNKWIDILPDIKMVVAESSDESREFRENRKNKFYNQIFFDTPDDLFDYLGINETV
ncbi:MAG: hypothetical protein K2M17_05530 [Bacilli bacterium]|nr:hypothetical protein [Bacilli bacterium]